MPYHPHDHNHDSLLMRSPEAEDIIRDLAARFLGTDYWSRDEDVRARSLGVGSEEALRADDVRRFVSPSYPISFPSPFLD
jgi:hypothetical protein